jgi:hypothetical protein
MICDLEPNWFFAPIKTLHAHMIQSYVNNFKFIIASKGEEVYILQLYGAQWSSNSNLLNFIINCMNRQWQT